jgi:hypothetical protein
MVGPELTSGTLEAIAALTSTECAPPLGSHPAVGQLVAIRYGAALADPKVASMAAEANGDPRPASPPPAGDRPPASAPPAGSGAQQPPHLPGRGHAAPSAAHNAAPSAGRTPERPASL